MEVCFHKVPFDEPCAHCATAAGDRPSIAQIKEMRASAQKSIEAIVNSLARATDCRVRVDIVDGIMVGVSEYVCDITLEIR